MTRPLASKATVIEALGTGRTFTDASDIAGYAEPRSFRQRTDMLGLRRITRGDVVIVVDRKRKA
jgi:hypothetical protein